MGSIEVAKGVVGTVDSIGKEGNLGYTKAYSLPKQRLQENSKGRRSLPHVGSENVDYILISSRDLDVVKKEIKSNPIEVMESNELQLPALYLKEGTKVDKAVFLKIIKKTLSELGFDKVVAI